MAIAYLIQTQASGNGKESSLTRAGDLVHDAHPEPGGLILFPEMFATGFQTDPPRESAERLDSGDSPTERFLQNLADKTDCTVLGGGIGFSEDPQRPFCNWTAAFVPGHGRPEAVYRKRHPFAEEARLFTPGTECGEFDWSGFTAFPFLCFDLRFPEDFRRARAKGASLFTVQAEWPRSREMHFCALLQARAIENQCYAIAVSRAGEDFATSLAFDPDGNEIVFADHRENVYKVVMNPDFVRNSRERFPLPTPQF